MNKEEKIIQTKDMWEEVKDFHERFGLNSWQDAIIMVMEEHTEFMHDLGRLKACEDDRFDKVARESAQELADLIFTCMGVWYQVREEKSFPSISIDYNNYVDYNKEAKLAIRQLVKKIEAGNSAGAGIVAFNLARFCVYEWRKAGVYKHHIDEAMDMVVKKNSLKVPTKNNVVNGKVLK